MSKTAVLRTYKKLLQTTTEKTAAPVEKRAMDVTIDLQKRKTASTGGRLRLTGERRCKEELSLYGS